MNHGWPWRSQTKYKCQLPAESSSKMLAYFSWRECGLTEKAEPPPTRDVNRDSGTASANGGWLRRLVRRLNHVTHSNLNSMSAWSRIMETSVSNNVSPSS